MARKIDRQGKRDESFEKSLQPEIVSKDGGERLGKKSCMKRNAFIRAVNPGRGHLNCRTDLMD